MLRIQSLHEDVTRTWDSLPQGREKQDLAIPLLPRLEGT